jgi:hypothetical protein
VPCQARSDNHTKTDISSQDPAPLLHSLCLLALLSPKALTKLDTMLRLDSGQLNLVFNSDLHQLELGSGREDVFLFVCIFRALSFQEVVLIDELITTDARELFCDALYG